MTQVLLRLTEATAVDKSRNWILFHVGFAIIAVVGLLLPLGSLGLRVLLLTVGYSVAILVLALRTNDRVLLSFWSTLAPMSVLMVLPDWFLSAELGTLVFPDTGAWFIGTMPLFMAFMWTTIALLPVMLLGWAVEYRRGLTAALMTVVAAGLAMFTLRPRFMGADNSECAIHWSCDSMASSKGPNVGNRS